MIILICAGIVFGIFAVAFGITLTAFTIADWQRRRSYARTESRHCRDTPATDPVYGDTTEHDAAFDQALDPAATADVRSAWAREPYRASTADRPPWDSAGFPAWQPPRPVETIDLPEGVSASADRDGFPATALTGTGTHLPGPARTETADRPARAGEPVLEGVIHPARPPAADYNPDTWLADEMAKLRAWSDQGIAAIEAWRDDRELVAA